ncbi:MAG: ABC transporter ATP-binding protein [Thermoanaerobaculia bacterium]
MTRPNRLGLRCSDISKSFLARNGRIQALEKVSFQVEPGEFLAILGPSGCGKTTLLKAIAGLTEISTGEISFSNGAAEEQPCLALAFQEHGLFPWMTVRQNVEFALGDKIPGGRTRQEVAREFVERVGLGVYADLFPSQLSRGMRQRVSIARAFARHPQLLLLDEPFASLDAQSRRVLQEELVSRWSENFITVILVTHDIEEAILLADRVLLMSSSPGRIAEEIPIDLPRPRDLGAWESAEVRAIRGHLWRALSGETRRRLAISS